MYKFLFFTLFSTLSWAVSLIERGVVAGYPFGGILDPGLEYMNINSYISHPSTTENASRNLIGEVPVFIYNSKENFFLNGQLQVHVTTPTLVLEKGGEKGAKSWYGYSFNPLGIAGLAWRLPFGFSCSNAIGGLPPWNSNLDENKRPFRFGPEASNAWIFLDAFGFSHYVKDDHNFTVTMFLGFPGVDQKYRKKVDPDFINLSLTMTKRFQHLEFGPIAYFTADYGTNENQQQFAIGPLVGYHWKHTYLQFWWAHDTYQNHFESFHSGGYMRFVFQFDQDSKEEKEY
jgi:hypothetical protein